MSVGSAWGGWRDMFFAEPEWLRGATWPTVGMAMAIALMQNAPQVMRFAFNGRHDPTPWQYVLLDLATQLAIAIAIVVVASGLMSIRRPRLRVPVALAAAVALGTFVPVMLVAWWLGGGADRFVYGGLLARRIAMPWGIAAAAWYFMQQASSRQAALRAAEVTRVELRTSALEARLRALQAQVEPHFLFNTLAHIRRLYRTDAVRARRMLDSFRTYLHAALPRLRGERATLGGEVELARAYLDVQKVRMGRRLTASIDVAATLQDVAFPSMMLLSLVENAIKHGLNELPEGGSVAISGMADGELLRVSVADTGRGIGDSIGSGVGLANIRGRLAALYGGRGMLTLAQNAPRGVSAVIVIPLDAEARRADASQAGVGQAA
jgi:sensor histidine kinase YesM